MSRGLYTCFFVAILAFSTALAQICAEDAEPNDVPDKAVALEGALCISGELIGSDQDLFRWEVSESDALKPWVFSIEGIVGELTRLDLLRLEFDDQDRVIAQETLYSLVTETGSLVRAEPVILAPGSYFFAVAKSGGEGSYGIDLEPGREFSRDYRVKTDLESNFAAFGNLNEVTPYTWQLSDEDAKKIWNLHVQLALGERASLKLLDANNQLVVEGVSDEKGDIAIYDLGLVAGQYTLELTSGTRASSYTLSSVVAGVIAEGVELEPNDKQADANRLDVTKGIEGQLTDSDDDYYTFRLDAEQAEKIWTLTLETTARLTLCLKDEDHQDLQCKQQEGGIELSDLQLIEGSYGLQLRGSTSGAYRLRFSSRNPTEQGVELEPNDTLISAFELGNETSIRGSLKGKDKDSFLFTTTGSPQRWRVQVLARGEGLSSIVSYNAAGDVQQSLTVPQGETRARLDNLLLLPGNHYLVVQGENVEYAVKFLALGPAELDPAEASAVTETSTSTSPPPPPSNDPDAVIPGPRPVGSIELEPNNDESRAERLQAGKPRVGLLGRSDNDYYRFFLANTQRVRIQVNPPEGKEVFFDLNGRRTSSLEEGGPAVYEGRLLPGDYFLNVRSREGFEAYYQLSFEQLDMLDSPADDEPNDRQSEASVVPANWLIEGSVGEHRDEDWYRLPSFSQDTPLKLLVEGDVRLAFFEHETTDSFTELSLNNETGFYEGLVPSKLALDLRVRGADHYSIKRIAESQSDKRLPEIDVKLESPVSEFAAYWFNGQKIDLMLTASNNSSELQSLDVLSASSDYNVQPSFLETKLELAAGETKTLPISLDIMPDIRDDQPIQISAGLKHEAGVLTDSLTLQPQCTASPINSQQMWPLPEALLGGFDLASPQLGASVPEDLANRGVFDGRTSPTTGASFTAGETISLELADSGLIAGVLLHPWGRTAVLDQLKDFEVLVSKDGQTFESVMTASVHALRQEQAFVFEEPIEASYVQLRLISNHRGSSNIGLGQFKVISHKETPPFAELNIAEPRLGGHVVWTNSLFGKGGYGGGNNPILTETIETPRGRLELGQTQLEWVVGFHHNRAAQITSLVWRDHDEQVYTPIDTLKVYVSTSSPVGPWESLGTWSLNHDGSDSLMFPRPLWARYVRFVAEDLQEKETYAFPETLSIMERASDASYHSVVAEWGHYNTHAQYEFDQGIAQVQVGVENDDNDSRERAQELVSGERVDGSVLVQEDSDWFKFEIPEGENTLTIKLQGDPSIAYNYTVLDEAGEPVFYETSGNAEVLNLSVFAEPGTYYLHLEEPPRTVIFSWDTSGSVSPYEAITYQSLARFAQAIEKGREDVQLLAYNDPSPRWLLRSWTGDTLAAMTAIANFDRKADSSNSESALLTASKALAKRQGTKAVLLMTDAETPGYNLTPELWQSLTEVRPRVFTFEISTGGSDYSQDLMQDWAAVNRGVYQYASNIGSFDAGFARASCLLRRPKRYTLEVTTSYQAPPGPGSLRVLPAAGVDRAVEVIFDASGSMNKELASGEQRIDVAKEVLNDLLTDLPADVPFALRAFGHIQPNSCETKLEIPLAPLDPLKVTEFVAGLEPKLLSQTPIADSLIAVADDLASVRGAKTVILITDGEESCEGDPQAAIRALRDQDVRLDLSIVGFAIEDEQSKTRLAQWAELGGGSYLDTNNAEELKAALDKSLNTSYEVLDDTGQVIATGVVAGEATSLPAGIYSIRIAGDVVFEEVRIPGETEISLSLDRP